MTAWEFRSVVDSDLPLLRDWILEARDALAARTRVHPDRKQFWRCADTSWPRIIAQFGSKKLRSTLAEGHPSFDYDAESADYDAIKIEVYIALLDNEPMGWTQCYSVDDYADENEMQAWLNLGFQPMGAGMDFWLGNPNARGEGLSTTMVRSFINDIVFGMHPNWNQVGTSPLRSNIDSCKALMKAGFELLGSFEDPNSATCDLYATHRAG